MRLRRGKVGSERTEQDSYADFIFKRDLQRLHKMSKGQGLDAHLMLQD